MEPNVNLLGRRPTTPDPRDFTVAMVSEASPLELAYQRMLAARGANPAVKAWGTEVMAVLAELVPEPEPPPPPAAGTDVVWTLPDPVLNQGDTPHCGGFGGCQWGNLEPVQNHFRDPDGHALYYESVAIGGVPGTENGVESRWVAKALQARGRLDTYAFASSVEEILEWVRNKGPVMMGTDWTNDMFRPDPDGYVAPTGGMAGGHFWCVCGDLPGDECVLALNSWADTWGLAGYFRVRYADLATLLTGLYYPGDAIVSPELAH